MKTGQFQNTLISENEKDLFSGQNENDPFSAPIYKGEKGKHPNFNFKSSTPSRRPFYFSPGPSDLKLLLPHYNYIIKADRRKSIIDESGGGHEKNIFRLSPSSLSYI